MKNKTNYETIVRTLESYHERAWENKDYFSSKDIAQAIGDLSLINWDKFFELMDLSLTPDAPTNLDSLNYLNLASLAENQDDIKSAVKYVKSIIEGNEPDKLDAYSLSGVILLIAMFIQDYYIVNNN